MNSATISRAAAELTVVAVTLLAGACAVVPRGPIFDPSYGQDLEQQAQQMMQAPFGSDVQSEGPRTNDGVQVVMQSGHAQEITTTAMSPDGREILSGSMDGTVKLWDVASGLELRTFSGFSMGLMAHATFSADGRLVIIGDGLQTYLFEGASGRKIGTLGAGGVLSLSDHAVIAGGGRYAAVMASGDRLGAQSESIRIIELATQREIWATPKGDMQLPLALSDDGNVLLTQRTKLHTGFFSGADLKTDVQIWDVPAKKLRGALPFLAADEARGARFVLSPDGRYVISEAPNDAAQLYALDSAQPVATLDTDGARYNYFHPFAFSADGTMAVRASQEGTVDVWLIPSGKVLKELPGKAAAFGPNGRTLVLGVEGSGAPAVYDLDTGKTTFLSGGAVAVWELAALAGGRTAAATMQDGSTRLWDLATGQLQRNLDCPTGTGAVSVSSRTDPAAVAVGCSDGSVWLWNLGSEPAPRQLLPPLTDSFARALVRFTPDGRRALLARNSTVSVIDVSDGRELRRIALPPGPRGPMSSDQQIDPEMFKNLSQSQREAIEKANARMADPAMQAQMQAGANMAVDLAIHPNGTLFVIARSNDVTVWDIDTGALVQTLGKMQAPTAGSGGDQRTAAQQLSGGAGRGDSKRLEQLMAGLAGNAAIVGGDPEEALAAMFAGASHLAFRNDGALMTLGSAGVQLWDVTSGRRIRSNLGHGGASSLTQGQRNFADFPDAMEGISDGAFSPDGRIVALVGGSTIHLQDSTSGAVLAELRGHRSRVASIAFTPNGQRLLSGGNDGTLRIWSVPRAEELAQLIALGKADYVAVTPDQYYRASKGRVKGVAFRVNNQIYPFEQFDLRFNRPDIVLERLGLADPATIQTYRQAYEHRLKKLGFTEAMLGTDFHLPTVEITTADIPVSTSAPSLPITVNASDDKYPLDRLQVFVNDVPVFGSRGIPIDGKARTFTTKIDVPLVAGRNKVQVSALNREGAESLRQTAYTNATGAFPPGDIYVVAIGVSRYANAAYNLRFAAKDAGDFASAYAGIDSSAPGRGAVHVLSLTNERATREQIRQAKTWLDQAKIGDLAIVFAAGHGMTDASNSYYFGTFDIDPQNPSSHGLPYEDFESLLDGIAPLRKMLLIDTCFSGEIDKDDPVVVASADDVTEGQVSMRAFKSERGVQVVADESPDSSGALNAALLRFQQDWFADLRRGTGAVVISSASGNEYAFEGEQWNNGVFTYALLQGLKNGAADTDHNQRITVGELQAYVIEQVRKLTAGGQNPTVRRENLDYDFEVY